MQEAIHKRGGVFEYPNIFQCVNGSDFKSDMKKLYKKHNFNVWRVTAKHKHIHTAVVESFNKEFTKQFYKSMDGHGFQDHDKLSARWAKNLVKSIVSEITSTKEYMHTVKPKKSI